MLTKTELSLFKENLHFAYDKHIFYLRKNVLLQIRVDC
jgi:hypothetical protein